MAEFAPVELGAVLGWTATAAQALMGDGLEIKHRLPRLWSLVLECRVPVHLARKIAGHTRPLAPEAALWADRLVTADRQPDGSYRWTSPIGTPSTYPPARRPRPPHQA